MSLSLDRMAMSRTSVFSMRLLGSSKCGGNREDESSSADIVVSLCWSSFKLPACDRSSRISEPGSKPPTMRDERRVLGSGRRGFELTDMMLD